MNKIKQFFISIGKWFKSLFVAEQEGVDPKMKTFWEKEGTKNAASSVMAILFGILIGFLLLIIMSFVSPSLNLRSAWEAFRILLGSVFYTGRTDTGSLTFGFSPVLFGNMLFRATPLILTGLSVALAFKTGLFNIGAPGQYLMGTLVTFVVALSIDTAVVPAWIVWILAFVGGMVAGFLWGCIPGLFKAFLNVNEVITCIMSNWIAINLLYWIFDGSQFINTTENTKAGFLYKTSHNGVQTWRFGLDELFKGSQVDGGIIIAIVIAIIVMIMLNKTTFGYELKACGSNRFASKYAGMNDKRNIILSMGIAGALAAAGASLYWLNGQTEYSWVNNMALPATGFNGIPVALLAYNNPIGTVFASLFMAYINIAGDQIKGATAYNQYISDLIIAIIVYLSAFSLLFKDILTGRIKIFNFTRHKPQPIAVAPTESVSEGGTKVDGAKNTDEEASK